VAAEQPAARAAASSVIAAAIGDDEVSDADIFIAVQ